MSIDFSRDRWAKIKEDARRFWDGKLERPLIQVALSGRDPGRPEPKLPWRPRTIMYGEDTPVAEVVDSYDYDLSRLKYLGDSFPCVLPDFGPGIIAGFMGAQVEVGAETTWFHPTQIQEIAELEFQPEPGNFWLPRIKAFMKAAVERWEGQVQISMTDLGGNLDILSIFRPSERLLLDLYDHPEEVTRLTWQSHELWWRYFDELDAVLRPRNPGYTAWANIFSEKPYYMLQCDFSYMIGPEMFDEFVKPEIAAMCRRLGNSFYHLDGIGQLPHLDSLLTIKELKGVQWIPGAGQPDMAHWPEVYRKIRKAGKLIQLYGDMATLDAVVAQLGSPEGLVIMMDGKGCREPEITAFLKRYGASGS